MERSSVCKGAESVLVYFLNLRPLYHLRLFHTSFTVLPPEQTDRDDQGSLLLSWRSVLSTVDLIFPILFTYTSTTWNLSSKLRGPYPSEGQVDRHNQGSLFLSLPIIKWSSSFCRWLDSGLDNLGPFHVFLKDPPLRGDPVQTDRDD